jgi:hypothetical protein
VSTTLARRLERLESVHRAAEERWRDESIRTLAGTMDPDHARFVREWMRAHVDSTSPMFAGASWGGLFERYRPPALVRAVWLLLAAHREGGTPLSLAPSVAEIYLADPDAFPTNACEGCRYLLPTQSTFRPDGTYKHRGWYLGECPVCGLDNHPEEEGQK